MNENAEKFKDLLATRDDLRTQIRHAAASYHGDVADDRAVFDAVVVPVARSVGLPITYEEARKAMLESRELSDEELEMVTGGTGIFYRMLISGTLVTTMVLGAVPATAIARGLVSGEEPSVVEEYAGGMGAEDVVVLDDAVVAVDEQDTTEDPIVADEQADGTEASSIDEAAAPAAADKADEMAFDEEEADAEAEAVVLVQEQLEQDLSSAALLASNARETSDSRASEKKRAKVVKGIDLSLKTGLALGKFAAGVATMNPGLLFGGGGDALNIVMSIVGIGHAGPSNQDIMDGIDDIRAELKDIKKDLDVIKRDVSDLSLKDDIQYASKLIDALIALESDCAGAANLYTPQMLAKIGVDPLPEDASLEQIVAWNEQVGKALKTAKRNKVSGFEYYTYYNERIRNDLTTIYSMLKEGAESNPVDAWTRYWEGTCNFESQAYGPKAWLRLAIETEVLRGYGLIATYTNIASDPDNIEISTTQEMQEMLQIAESIDPGVSPEEALAGVPVYCYSLGRTARCHNDGVAFKDKESFGASVTSAQIDEFLSRLHGNDLYTELMEAGLYDGHDYYATYALGLHNVDQTEGLDGIVFISWKGDLWGIGQTVLEHAYVRTTDRWGGGNASTFFGDRADSLQGGTDCFYTLDLQ